MNYFMSKQEEINEKGWVLVKGVFTPAEIQQFREFVEKDKDHAGDLLSAPHLSAVMSDKRIAEIYRECLGTDEAYYFGDSSISIDKEGSGFHKDSRERDNPKSHEFTDVNYSLFRMAIYLQDHSTHSKGICLREHSHRTPLLNKGKIINVRTEVGDVVLWKLTTSHSANADVISLFPNHSFHPRLTRRIPNFLKQKSISPRMALFSCLGKKDAYSEEYVTYLKARPYAINRWNNSKYSDSVLQKMKENGVYVEQNFGIEGIDASQMTEGHVKMEVKM